MTRGKKYEPPLYLDMDFEEALERFGTTDPEAVKELMNKTKKKKSPGLGTPATRTARPSKPKRSDDD